MAFPFSLYPFSLYTFSLILFLSRLSHAQTTPAVYVFGDSLADVGNNNYLLLSPLKANYPHNGIDYPGRKPTGRFSNGRNFPDLIAGKLGLPSPPPYLSISGSSATDTFLKGVSFASGGAGILNTTNKGQCLSLDKQIEYFSRVRGALQEKLGNAETQRHLSKSIFFIVIGSNDLFGYYNSKSSDMVNSSPQVFVDSLVFKLKTQMKSIYDLGAKKIAFIGLGPIGCTPSQRVRGNKGDCNNDPNLGSIKLNEGIVSLFKEMKGKFGDFNYSFFDTYDAFMEILESPSIYGFTEVKAACCGLGDLNAKVACLPLATYCSNRDEYIFWDFYHPTEAAASKLSEKIFDGSTPLAQPLNVRQLASLSI